MDIFRKMFRLLLWILLVTYFFGLMNKRVEGCHAGHQRPPPKEEDEEEEEEEEGGIIIIGARSGEITLDRSKRQLSEHGDDFAILRAYFRECMFDKVEDLWEWRSIIDFTVLKTLWFLYSGTVACSEEKGRDDSKCWKDCIDVYLRTTSSLRRPAKECVEEYEKDFKLGKFRYTPKKQNQSAVVYEPLDSNYKRCVQTQYNEADPLSLIADEGIYSVPVETELDIGTVVKFIRTQVQCIICDYSELPSGQRKPDFKENIIIGGQVLQDGPVTYEVAWPFSFEALVRRDARLRRAINFCNGELETTFRKNPPTDPEWTQWFTWGTCNAACGKPGSQKRVRVCLNENEAKCIGNKFERRVCYNRKCASWSNWTPYTPCFSTCDLSKQYSFRECTKGKPGEEGCPGERMRQRSCAVESCKVPWSQWSPCSVTCGTGTRRRTGGDSLLKIETKYQTCSAGKCPEKWTNWSQWGQCSKTCGNEGRRRRIRFCLNQVPCTERSTEMTQCYLNPCVKSTSWGAWSDWSSCIFKRRSRVCVGGNVCQGEAEDYQRCSSSECPVHQKPSRHVYQIEHPVAAWTHWKNWSPCQGVCGRSYRTRYRNCVKSSSHVAPPHCHGYDRQSMYCWNKSCSVTVKSACENDAVWDIICQNDLFDCNKENGKKLCRKTCKLC